MKIEEHIKEIRKRLFRVFLFSIVIFVFAFIFSEEIIFFLTNFYELNLVSIYPLESLGVQFTLSGIITLFLALPYLIIEIYNYIKDEIKIKNFYLYIFLIYLLGTIGLLFGIFGMTEIALESLATSSLFTLYWSAEKTFSLIFVMTGISIISMELIIIIPLLTRMEVVSKGQYYKKRKIYICILLIIIAMITPTTDAVSLGISMFPIIAGTEIGFLISKKGGKC